MAIRERLVYAIDIVTDGANKGLANFRQSVSQADGAVGKFKAGWGAALSSFTSSPVAIGAAGTAVASFAANAIGDASELEESINAVTVSYGSSSDEVLKLGENSAKAFGMAKSEFNAFAVQFSSFAKNIAAGSGQSVEAVLGDLTQRVADFASVMNLDVAEASQVFMSTLAGETEPIRRFGKDVSAAAVEQFALATGLVKSKTEMTEAIKVQARYGLLMQQTANTQGDFTNTSDGLANSQRILRAQMKDLSAEIGQSLTPAAQELTASLSDLVDVAENLKVPELLKFGVENTALNRVRQLKDGIQDLFGGGGDKSPQEQAAELSSTLSQNLVQASIDAAEAQQEHNDTLDKANAQADEYVMWLIKQGEANEEVAAAAKTKAEWDKKAADAAQRHEDAVRDVADALEEQRAAATDLVGGDIAVRNAQREAAAAAAELNKVLDDQATTLGDAGAAIDDAADAQIHAAQVARDYRLDQMRANGTVVDGKVETQVYKEELQRLAGQLQGPLKAAIEGYIADLAGIPRNIGTTITLTRAGRAGDTVGTGRGIERRAAGGPTRAGGLYEVNEGGASELLHEGGKTFLMAGANGNVSPVTGASSNGARVINITVNAGLGANGGSIGQAIVEEIRRYERGNGTGWRR